MLLQVQILSFRSCTLIRRVLFSKKANRKLLFLYVKMVAKHDGVAILLEKKQKRKKKS